MHDRDWELKERTCGTKALLFLIYVHICAADYIRERTNIQKSYRRVR